MNPKCRYCGKTLVQRYTWKEDEHGRRIKGDPTGKFGYGGNGLFCTQSCGWAWACKIIQTSEKHRKQDQYKKEKP